MTSCLFLDTAAGLDDRRATYGVKPAVTLVPRSGCRAPKMVPRGLDALPTADATHRDADRRLGIMPLKSSNASGSAGEEWSLSPLMCQFREGR